MKPKKDSSPKNKQTDEEKGKSLTFKEGYEETSPCLKKPSDDAEGGDVAAEKEAPEPVIVFKKVFSPKKNGNKPVKTTMESPQKQKVKESPKNVSGNGDDELTVTLTPKKNGNKPVKTTMESPQKQ